MLVVVVVVRLSFYVVTVVVAVVFNVRLFVEVVLVMLVGSNCSVAASLI